MKKSNDLCYISPYSLLIYKGIYKFILLTIFSIIFIIFIPIMLSIENNFFIDMKNFTGKHLLIVFIYLICYFLKNLFNWILIDKFSPNHLALSLILENISYVIIYLIIYGIDESSNDEEYSNIEISLRIIIYIILFISALIHNEIFIITKCGLGNNTKLFLDEKEKKKCFCQI